MIIVDHSSWGIDKQEGGVRIGVYSDREKEMFSRFIPVSYFVGENFFRRAYAEQALEVVKECFTELGVTRRESVYVGNRPVLSDVQAWLSENRYRYYSLTSGWQRYDHLFDQFQKDLNHNKNVSVIRRFNEIDWDYGSSVLNYESLLPWNEVEVTVSIRSLHSHFSSEYGWYIESYLTCDGETLLVLHSTKRDLPNWSYQIIATGHCIGPVNLRHILADLQHLLHGTRKAELRKKLNLL